LAKITVPILRGKLVKNVDRTEVQLIKELRQRIAELENFPELDLDSAVEIDWRGMLNG
jgi:hypothetical protein